MIIRLAWQRKSSYLLCEQLDFLLLYLKLSHMHDIYYFIGYYLGFISRRMIMAIGETP